jgi:hypothetical protein
MWSSRGSHVTHTLLLPLLLLPLLLLLPGFVGSPWTLATYIIEGASSSLYKTIK